MRDDLKDTDTFEVCLQVTGTPVGAKTELFQTFVMFVCRLTDMHANDI